MPAKSAAPESNAAMLGKALSAAMRARDLNEDGGGFGRPVCFIISAKDALSYSATIWLRRKWMLLFLV